MPAKKPAALKLLNGRGPGKDSAGRELNMGPTFVRDAPDPPDWLGGEARGEWERVVPELNRLNLLSRVTRSSLVSYCQTWEAFVEAVFTIRREGYYIDAKQGMLRHPAVTLQLAASAELRRWAIEYGLTPASEQKIKPPEVADGANEDAIA